MDERMRLINKARDVIAKGYDVRLSDDFEGWPRRANYCSIGEQRGEKGALNRENFNLSPREARKILDIEYIPHFYNPR